jgi:hypothetical protein
MRVSPGPADTFLLNSSGVVIDPSTEAGNLATVATNTNKLDVNLSTVAKDATLTGGTQKSQIVDGSGNVASTALVNSKRSLNISVADTSVGVSGVSTVGVAPSQPPVAVSGVDSGGLKRHFLTSSSGKLFVINDVDQALRSGTGFIIRVVASVGNTETNILYIKNIDSTKSITIRRAFFRTTSAASATFRWYVATGTVTGSAGTAVNRTIGSSLTSITSIITATFTGLTRTSQLGINIASMSNNQFGMYDQEIGVMLLPGSAIAFTALGSASGTNADLTVYTEED